MKSTLTTIFFLFACVCLHAQAKLEFDWTTKPGFPLINGLVSHNGHLLFSAYSGYEGYKSFDFDPVTGQSRFILGNQTCNDAAAPIAAQDHLVYYPSNDGLVEYNLSTGLRKLVIDDLIIERMSGAIVGGKLFFRAESSSGTEPLYAYDISLGTYEVIDMSTVGGNTNLRPTAITEHLGSVYFNGVDANNKSGFFKYEIATKTPKKITTPNPSPHFGFAVRSMVSCNGSLYFTESWQSISLPGLIKYNEVQNTFTTVSSIYPINELACLDGIVFTRNANSLGSYNTLTGQETIAYDIVPGVTDEVGAMTVHDGVLLVESRPGANAPSQQYEFEPSSNQFLPLNGVNASLGQFKSLLSNEMLTKIGDTYYFAGVNASGSEVLMQYKKGDATATEALDVYKGNNGSYYTGLGFFQDKGYILDYSRELIQFDTGAVPNPISVTDLAQIDSGVGLESIFFLPDAIYINTVSRQGQKFPFGRYVPGIGVKTYGNIPNSFVRTDHFTSYQNKVYFTQSTSTTDSIFVFDPANETLAFAFLGGSGFMLTDSQYLYTLRDSQLYRFDGNTLELLIDSVLFAETSRAKPFILGDYLYCFTRADQNTYDYSFERMHRTTLVRETYYFGEVGFELAILAFQGKVYFSPQQLSLDPKFLEYDPQTNTLKELLVNNAPPPVWYGVGDLSTYDGKMIIGLTTDQFGYELYEYDLQTTETKLLEDIWKGSCHGGGSMPTQYGSKLYFGADDGFHGAELWSYRNCFQASISAQPSTIGLSSGSAAVQTTGGTGPFTYQWSNGATTASINNVPAGIYAVTTTDAKGCESTLSVYVDQLVSFAPEAEEMQLRVYPNPFGQRLTLEARQPLTGFGTLSTVGMQVQLIDLQGRIITSRDWESTSPLVLDGLDLPAGVYFLRLRQMSDGVMRTVKVVCH